MLNEWISKALGGGNARELMLSFEWSHGKPKIIERLEKYIDLASLHADDSLIKEVVLQALRFGVDYITNCASPQASEFMKCYRAAVRDYQRLKEFTRLHEVGKMLVADVKAKPGLERMLASYFRSRYKRDIVVLNNDKAYMFNGSTHIIPRSEFVEKTGYRPSKDDVWETFYTSQFISGRRNRRYAMRSMPKKHWKSDRVAGHYIEFGVNPVKLTEFF